MSTSRRRCDAVPLATAVRQLTRVRERELWIRVLLGSWCTLALLWLLPLGPWSASTLTPLVAVITGSGLISAGLALTLLHRRVTDTTAIHEALVELRRLPAQARETAAESSE